MTDESSDPGGSHRAAPPPRVRQAILLVGGKGSRLKELTRATPKPLMEIGNGRVFLDLLIENVARQGFDRILLLAGHLGEQIVDRYDGRQTYGSSISVAIEPEPKGTGGALRWSRDKLDPLFLVINGDTYFDIPYRMLETALHEAPTALAAMALCEVDDAARYGSVEMQGANITRFYEKDASANPAQGLINAGVYLMRREVVDAIGDGQVSLEAQVFPELTSSGRLLGASRKGYFIDIGLPQTLCQARCDLPTVIQRPALFLDRDGVMNADHGYVHHWNQLDLLDGVAEVIRAFNEANWFVFVITNQAGVAHGYYDESAIDALHDQIRDWLALKGAHVDAFFYCPYHPQGVVDAYRAEHPDRKPHPGMLLRAFKEWPVLVQRSFLVGDRDTDLAAAAAAGIEGHHFQGDNLAEFFSARGLWPKPSMKNASSAADQPIRDDSCCG